jgi:hypothetical protein
VVRESGEGPESGRTITPWVGWIGPEGSVVRNETVQFVRPGEYEVVWGDRRYVVRVVPERGTASVVGVSATRNRSTGQVVVETTVRNDDERPTYAEIPVSIDGQRVSTVTTVLKGGGTRTVVRSLNVSRQAPYSVVVGDATTTVGQRRATGQSETEGSLPLVPILGVLGTVALLGGVVWWVVVRE